MPEVIVRDTDGNGNTRTLNFHALRPDGQYEKRTLVEHTGYRWADTEIVVIGQGSVVFSKSNWKALWSSISQYYDGTVGVALRSGALTIAALRDHAAQRNIPPIR